MWGLCERGKQKGEDLKIKQMSVWNWPHGAGRRMKQLISGWSLQRIQLMPSTNRVHRRCPVQKNHRWHREHMWHRAQSYTKCPRCKG